MIVAGGGGEVEGMGLKVKLTCCGAARDVSRGGTLPTSSSVEPTTMDLSLGRGIELV